MAKRTQRTTHSAGSKRRVTLPRVRGRSRRAQGPQVVAIIPARLGSTRFPGKVLADATGKTLIEHVYESAKRAASLTRVVVATDDVRVHEAVKKFGGDCVMTSPTHPNGTSRLAEAATILKIGPDDLIVNVQGDEPEIEPSFIDAAVRILKRSGVAMSTAAVPFADDEDPSNPNLVKVVTRLDGQAMYFSRSVIPFVRDTGVESRPLKHLGLYVYRRPFLKTYLSLPTAPAEQAESLEQLRVLSHGHPIAVAVCQGRTFGGIDTPEQYEAFVKRWRSKNG